MKIIKFDLVEGVQKGNIFQFENNNLNETYSLYMFREKMIYDLTGITIDLIMVNSVGAGQVIRLSKGTKNNEVLLPVTSNLTKVDGTYDCQLIFKKTNGYQDKTVPFNITIANDLLTNMTSELVSQEEYQYLVDKFDKLVADMNKYKTGVNSDFTKFKTDTNTDITKFKNDTNADNTVFKDKVVADYEHLATEVLAYDDRINTNAREIQEAKQAINQGKYLPFEGEYITVNNSLQGSAKDTELEGVTYQNIITKYIVPSLSGTGNSATAYAKVPLIRIGVVYTAIKIGGSNIREWSFGDGTTNLFKGVNDKYTFTIPSGFNIPALRLGFFPTTAPLVIANFDSLKYLILEGDYTNKPIPSYFEGIESVSEEEGNKISILSTGKNVFDITRKEKGIFYEYNNGNQVTHTEGDSYTFDVGKNTEYVVSREVGNYSNLTFWDDNNRFISGIANFTTFITPSNTSYCKIAVNSNLKNFQIEKGKMATQYVSFEKEDKKEILLTEPLGGFPTGDKDKIQQRDDGVYLTKRIGRYTITSTETIVQGGKTTSEFFEGLIYGVDVNFGSNLLCNNFKAIKESVQTLTDEFIRASDESFVISIQQSKLSTRDVAGFKKWLRDNPTTVHYDLKTPVETKLDIPTIDLDTYATATNFLCTNSIKPNIKLEAPCNVQAVISGLKVENEGLEAENSIIKNDQLTLVDGLISMIAPPTMMLPYLPIEETEESAELTQGFENPLLGKLLEMRERLVK